MSTRKGLSHCRVRGRSADGSGLLLSLPLSDGVTHRLLRLLPPVLTGLLDSLLHPAVYGSGLQVPLCHGLGSPLVPQLGVGLLLLGLPLLGLLELLLHVLTFALVESLVRLTQGALALGLSALPERPLSFSSRCFILVLEQLRGGRLTGAGRVASPPLEPRHLHLGDGPKAVPPYGVVVLVGVVGLLRGVGADDDLVLIKRSGLRVYLVNDVDLIGFRSNDDRIHRATVHALGPADEPIVVRHLLGPGLTLIVHARASGACGVLDRDFKPMHLPDRAGDRRSRLRTCQLLG